MIIYVMCGNSLPDNLSGSLLDNSHTSKESVNDRIQLHPKVGEKLRANLAQS